MARRRRPEPTARPDDERPEWLRHFSTRRYLAEHGGSADGYYEAAKRHRHRCREWLEERGLVAFGYTPESHEEYRRICRQEPHRVVRDLRAGPGFRP